MADWNRIGTVRRRGSVKLDGSGNGNIEMTDEALTVAFTGGLAGSVATAVLEGDSYLWM